MSHWKKDTRRFDKFAKSHKRFQRYGPRTQSDACGPRAHDPGRSERAATARETLRIIADGGYGDKSWVTLQPALDAARDGTVLYTSAIVTSDAASVEHNTEITVTHETTLAACRRLAASSNSGHVAALNFASAKKPGGGFRNGARAQEESLARASGLFHCIGGADSAVAPLYAHNRSVRNTGLYSHTMAFSPHVPVFRDDEDDDALLDVPYYVSFITSPAVNAHVALSRGVSQDQIRRTMTERIHRILSVACAHGVNSLVLGAFGCGVFSNDTAEVARMFFDALRSLQFSGRFRTVVFAVLGDAEHRVFADEFARFTRDQDGTTTSATFSTQ